MKRKLSLLIFLSACSGQADPSYESPCIDYLNRGGPDLRCCDLSDDPNYPEGWAPLMPDYSPDVAPHEWSGYLWDTNCADREIGDVCRVTLDQGEVSPDAVFYGVCR